MKKIVLVINAETNVVEQSLLLTDDNLPRMEMHSDAKFINIEIPTEDQASTAALDALRAKLTQPLPPNAKHVMDDYESPRNSQVTSEISSSELCYDEWSGRYFMSSIEKLERAALQMNLILSRGEETSLNDFYDLLELQPIQAGADVGWNPADEVELRFGASLSPEGRPALSFWFTRSPRGVEKWH